MFKSAIAHAQETAPASPTTGQGMGLFGSFGSMLPLVAIFAVMWFFMIAPQQRRDKQRRAMLAALSKGDHVVTTGGICGTIVALHDTTVVLKVSDEPATKIEFVRSAIAQVTREDSKK